MSNSGLVHRNPSHAHRCPRAIVVPQRPVTPVAASAKAHIGPLPAHSWVIRRNTEILMTNHEPGGDLSRDEIVAQASKWLADMTLSGNLTLSTLLL